jgi:chromosome segregation ATPase
MMSSEQQNMNTYQAPDPRLAEALEKLWDFANSIAENLSSLKEENSMLYDELDHVKNATKEERIQHYEDKISALNSRIDSFLQVEEQNSGLKDSLENTSLELNRVKDEIGKKNSIIADLERNLALSIEKNKFIPVLTEKIEAAEQQSLELKSKIGNEEYILKQLGELEEKYSILQKDNSRKNNLIIERTKEIDSLRGKNAELENAAYKLRKILEEKDESLAEASRHKETIDSNENEKTKILGQLEKANIAIEQAEFEKSELNEKIAELEKIIAIRNDHAEELTNLKEMLNYRDGQLKSLKAEAEKLSSISSSRETAIDKYRRQIAELESRLENIENQYSNKIESLEQEKRRIADKFEELDKEFTLNARILDEIRTECDETDSANKELAQKLRDCEKLVNELNLYKEDYDILSHSNSNLKKELEENNSKLAAFSRLEEKIKELQDKLAGLSNELTITDLKYKQALSHNSELENIVKSRYEQINQLETQLNNLMESAAANKTEKAELARKIDSFIDKIDKLAAGTDK